MSLMGPENPALPKSRASCMFPSATSIHKPVAKSRAWRLTLAAPRAYATAGPAGESEELRASEAGWRSGQKPATNGPDPPNPATDDCLAVSHSPIWCASLMSPIIRGDKRLPIAAPLARLSQQRVNGRPPGRASVPRNKGPAAAK